MPDRRNPFDGVTDFVSELYRMRSLGIHGALEGSGDNPERTHASAWVPSTDILARGDDLVIRIELAGVDPADVDLRFSHGVLTVSGNRHAREVAGDEGAEFLVRERYHGEFRRALTLPDSVTSDDIEAAFEDGLVTITVQGAAADRDDTRIEITHRTPAKKARRRPATD